MVHIVKKRPFVAFGIAALLIVAGVTAFGPLADAQQGGEGNVLNLVVRNNPVGTFSGSSPDFGDISQIGAFYVQGVIFDADDENEANPLGTFRCWGWNARDTGGTNVVCQEFSLDGWGKLQVQGSEIPRPAELAVVGGTGHFVDARGVIMEGVPDISNPDGFPRFWVTLQLVHGKHHGP